MRRALLLGGLLAASAASRAALWGYVDGSGIAHFADHRVDSRYSLVLGEKGDAPEVERVPGKTNAPASILTWLEIAPEVKRVQPWVREAALRDGVDAELIVALIAVESGFNAKALSAKGAIGLMQLMPTTAQRFMAKGLEPKQVMALLAEPRTNIAVGTRVMADLLQRHPRIDVALAAWSAGEGAVQRSGGRIPEIGETRAHVHQVLELYWALLQQRQARAAQDMKLHASQ